MSQTIIIIGLEKGWEEVPGEKSMNERKATGELASWSVGTVTGFLRNPAL